MRGCPMKMNKNRLLTVLLVLCLLSAVVLCFAACGEKEAEPTTPGELTYVSKFDSGDGWPEVNKPLSWEEINKFPIKSRICP